MPSKSRNADMYGPNDSVFFNSNREKSPVPGEVPDGTNSRLLSATAVKKSNKHSTRASDHHLSPSTGETGMQNDTGEKSQKIDPRLTPLPMQKSLVNKKGLYDQVI